jgi:hypothetical protein
MKYLKNFLILLISQTLAIRLTPHYNNQVKQVNYQPAYRGSDFLQLASRMANPNDLFRDVTASEDKYDPLSKPKKELVDYNRVFDYSLNDIEKVIKDDMTGEQVNYDFD